MFVRQLGMLLKKRCQMNDRNNLHNLASAAILALRSCVRWKPGKDIQHLKKRIRVGHLPDGKTLDEYNQIVTEVLHQEDSDVYHYPYDSDTYFGVVGKIGNIPWLVILSPKGIMETAFPPKDIDTYLKRRGFIYLGKMSEIIK
jgi:hypothetical protein